MALKQSYLSTLSPRDKALTVLKEMMQCKDDVIYCIENYFTVLEPKGAKRIPFLLYPHQLRAVRQFDENRYNITMKSRQMGFTAVSAAYVAWYMITKQNQVINVLANKLKTSRKFLKMVRDVLDDARKNYPWLVADYVFNNNGKDSFTLKTGCIISAESNNEDACRGETINLLVIDEVAAIDRSNPTRMEEIWSSAGITLTRSQGKCLAISTPKGQAGWYYEQYTHAADNGWAVVEAHWTEHPDYSKGMYQYIKDEQYPEGKIVFLNEEWPDVTNLEDLQKYKTKETYQFILDGRKRSPWYDYESKKLGTRLTKCELDCSFAGSGGEVIDSEVLRDITTKARECPPINIPDKGIMKSYKEFKAYNPDHSYIVSADVSTGDGSDFSAFVVMDISTKEMVATYKDIVDPNAYAKILMNIAIRYGKCMILAEYQGPGLTVLLELKDRLQYKNLYYSTLKKQEPTKVQKRKLGFWQGDNTRTLGGAKLEECINLGEIKIYSEDFIAELHTWIWDTDGKRRHAPGKHDDLIMAATMSMFYIYYVVTKRETNKNMMKSHFEIQRGGFGFDNDSDLRMMFK